MRAFGTSESGGDYTYDSAQNPLLVQNVISTTGAPFGRPVVQQISNSEYGTVQAAIGFARALHAVGIAVAAEATTAVTSYPKYDVVLPAGRVNAGAIASVIGNDPGYGFTPEAKAGHIAELLGETYDAAVHVPLMRALLAAAEVAA
jgi:hypothetical protein